MVDNKINTSIKLININIIIFVKLFCVIIVKELLLYFLCISGGHCGKI